MRAVILKGVDDLELVDDWPVPECGPDDVVVRIRAVGVCGTDLSAIAGHAAAPVLPWVMGHEGGGEIVEVGANVTDRHVGQRVVIEPNFPCMTCEWCRSGATSVCADMVSPGWTWQGVLAEYYVGPARHAWPVPDSVSDAALGCIEPLAVGVTAVRRSGIGAGEEALIVGSGSVGQFVAQALRAVGAQGYVQDPHDGRVATAVRLGARPVADYAGDGFAYAFETSGAAPVWPGIQASVRRRGTITVVGMPSRLVEVDQVDVVERQLTIQGSLIYDHPTGFADVIAAIEAGTLVAEASVEARYAFEDSLEAFRNARGVAGKTLIEFS